MKTEHIPIGQRERVEFRISSCTGKKKYLTYEHARKDAREIRRKRSVKTTPYHCPICNYWHVGTDTRQKYKK